MNLSVQLKNHFGAFCADGAIASSFRQQCVDPFVHGAEKIVFDFDGIRNMNSSFANALLGNLVRRNPDSLSKLRFANVRPGLEVLIKSAIFLAHRTAESERDLVKDASEHAQT